MPKQAALRDQAIEMIHHLPPDKLRMVVDFLSYLEDREAWEATWELASRPEVVESLRRSEEDVQAGRVRCWKHVKRDV